jgi:hypothetical protein
LRLVLVKVDSNFFLLLGAPEKLLVLTEDFLRASLFVSSNVLESVTDSAQVALALLLHLFAKLLETLGVRQQM